MVAEKIAITESYKYITMDDIASEIRDGKKGIDGIGSNGKMTKNRPSSFSAAGLVQYNGERCLWRLLECKQVPKGNGKTKRLIHRYIAVCTADGHGAYSTRPIGKLYQLAGDPLMPEVGADEKIFKYAAGQIIKRGKSDGDGTAAHQRIPFPCPVEENVFFSDCPDQTLSGGITRRVFSDFCFVLPLKLP